MSRYSQAGISLVELMVGLTIGLIITAGAFTILFSNQKLILEKEVMDRSQENFRFASTTITRLVRQATSFGFPESNNELVVYFDRSQRDCLGKENNSSMNTFKVNEQNELVCILAMDDGTTQTVTLAKDIPEVKFAYGIQNGVSANSLVYQPFFSGASSTVNTSVSNVWGTVTSVLSQMSVSDGTAKQSTIDFISTSHFLAMTQLASSGGSSKVNSSVVNPPVVNPPVVNPPVVNPTCPSIQSLINVKYKLNGDNSYSNNKWSDLKTIGKVDNKSTVSIDVSQVQDSKNWELKWQYSGNDTDQGNVKPLANWMSKQLQGSDSVTLTLICGNETSELKFSR
ncbi:hypothetical protein XA39_01100 [Acinetobacter tandoii]|nr:hypothetical protein XA39_01100 [Acinetobacter tandoii]